MIKHLNNIQLLYLGISFFILIYSLYNSEMFCFKSYRPFIYDWLQVFSFSVGNLNGFFFHFVYQLVTNKANKTGKHIILSGYKYIKYISFFLELLDVTLLSCRIQNMA